MANVYITAWDSAEFVARGDPKDFLVAVIDGANSATLSGTNKKRKRVRIHADEDVFINFFSDEADPTVSTDGSDAMPLDADNPEYHDMQVGRIVKAIARP